MVPPEVEVPQFVPVSGCPAHRIQARPVVNFINVVVTLVDIILSISALDTPSYFSMIVPAVPVISPSSSITMMLSSSSDAPLSVAQSLVHVESKSSAYVHLVLFVEVAVGVPVPFAVIVTVGVPV